jgi:hypothetical protein
LNGSKVVAEEIGESSNGRANYMSHAHGNGSGKATSSKLKAQQEIFNGSAPKVVEPTRGRIWVCDVRHFPHYYEITNDVALFQVYEK